MVSGQMVVTWFGNNNKWFRKFLSDGQLFFSGFLAICQFTSTDHYMFQIILVHWSASAIASLCSMRLVTQLWTCWLTSGTSSTCCHRYLGLQSTWRTKRRSSTSHAIDIKRCDICLTRHIPYTRVASIKRWWGNVFTHTCSTFHHSLNLAIGAPGDTVKPH